jgi:hypothetical protein
MLRPATDDVSVPRVSIGGHLDAGFDDLFRELERLQHEHAETVAVRASEPEGARPH